MAENKKFVERKIANLVTRRDYGKQSVKFDEPDLLEIQRESYKKFLKTELGELIASYFPIQHTKNKTHRVIYDGIKMYPGKFDELEARYMGKTFEQSVYVNLKLVNDETGEIKDVKKSKKDPHDGVFFANIPMMTTNGTFIINGIEKFVISQTVRSPGAYILTKSKIKLSGAKKVTEGYICEVYPNRGTMMNIYIDEKKKDNLLRIIARNQTSDAAVTFSATQFLKGLGLTQKTILEIFGNADLIAKSLIADGEPKSYSSKFEGCYTHATIGNNAFINSIRKSVIDCPTKEDIKHIGLPVDKKIRFLVYDWAKLEEAKADILKQIDADPTNRTLVSKKIEIDQKINDAKDLIITEKAAMDIITTLGLSKRPTEQLSLQYPDFCYQDYLVRQFMTEKIFDIAPAGRSKINHKMRVTERLYQKVLFKDLLYKESGKIFMKKDTLITKDEIDKIKKAMHEGVLDTTKTFSVMYNTSFQKAFKIDKKFNVEAIDVYADNDEFDEFVNVLGVDPTEKSKTLTMSDIIAMISYAINLPWNIGNYDDIEHLGNKRLRLIHEQFKQKLTAGMARVEKHIKDKLASLSTPTMNDEQKEKKRISTTIKSIVNTKPFQQVVKAFFNSYQLTQFIDQQNPLSELTNKRRISAMGDGGIRREDPNLNIRDVHYSHYGRICPIETPEGMNIGLIMSLASFAKVDENGFIVSPYFVVDNGVVTDKIRWLNAHEEDEYIIGESMVPRDENGKITQSKVVGRYRGFQQIYDVRDINYIDVSPRQVVSIAASTIPFLEHDDTARALMGSNMQRQAVPLLKPYAPIVGTGAEYKIAHDSGLCTLAKQDGEVLEADGNKITIQYKDGSKEKLPLIKYRQTNQSTCNNQFPIVDVGQKVKEGQVVADGPAMFNGELAIGRNPIIAYTTWHGYNFEDAIVISKRLIQDDWYTSVSIIEKEIKCVTTKNGDEEISRDLPNVSDDVKHYLDEQGIIMVGAEVKEGDILVGRISPKGVADYSPEEKLLNALFGNKSHGYRDSSLKVRVGEAGTIIGTKKFRKRQGDNDTKPDADGWIPVDFDDETIQSVKVYIAQKRKLQIGDKMSGRHGNKGTISRIIPVEDMPYLEDGTPVDILLSPLGVPSRMNIGQILEVHLGWAMRNIAKKKLFELIDTDAPVSDYVQLFGLSGARTKILKKVCKDYFKENKINKAEQFSNIDLSIILSKVGMSIEDISYKASTPVFSGAQLDDVAGALKEAGIDPSKTKAKTTLIDGQTGEKFDGEITVGIMYMLKLDHMVDDKIHARAIGPYSKVSQQPLGGRSQDGGQRFGEMEVWALEAYGATYNLREILTIKSDDAVGRNWTYNAIIKGKPLPKTSLPESFKLLTKQLQGLCLKMTVTNENDEQIDMNEYSKSQVSEDEISESQKTEQGTVVSEPTESSDEDGYGNLL